MVSMSGVGTISTDTNSFPLRLQYLPTSIRPGVTLPSTLFGIDSGLGVSTSPPPFCATLLPHSFLSRRFLSFQVFGLLILDDWNRGCQCMSASRVEDNSRRLGLLHDTSSSVDWRPKAPNSSRPSHKSFSSIPTRSKLSSLPLQEGNLCLYPPNCRGDQKREPEWRPSANRMAGTRVEDKT
jgi:hypothetical protein